MNQTSQSFRSTERNDSNHLFVNNVRFLSMAAIVCMHSIDSYVSVVRAAFMPDWLYYLVQPLKFATIAFFLAAGFLFGERMDASPSATYLKRRMRVIFMPWLTWFLMFWAMCVAGDFLHGRLVTSSPRLLISCLYSEGVRVMVHSPFWFVPNLLVALVVLLACRRMIDKLWFGAVLLVLSLFYGVNVYGCWIASEHTKAVLGFVFYLWLGAWAARHYPAVESRLARIPASVLGGSTLAACGLASVEQTILLRLGSIDSVNTLRITNQVFSVLVVLLFVKIRHQVWPRFVNVRAETYPIFLSHSAAICVLAAILKRVLPRVSPPAWWVSVPGTLAVVAVIFLTAYAMSLLISKWLIAHPSLSWTVGPPARKLSQPAPRTLPHPQLSATVAGRV